MQTEIIITACLAAMRTLKACIKILSVVLIIGAATVAWGIESMTSSFARHLPISKINISIDTNNNNSAIGELENKVLDKRVRMVERADDGDMPFLAKCIKYNTLHSLGFIQVCSGCRE